MKKETKLSEGAEESKAPETTEAPEASQEKPAESTEAPKPAEEPKSSEEPSESLSMKDINRFTEKFGAEKGLEYLKAGKSFEEALSIEFDALKAKQRVVGTESRGEEQPVGTFGASDKKAAQPKVIDAWSRDVIRINGRSTVPSNN